MEYYREINEIISKTNRYQMQRQVNFKVGHAVLDTISRISTETGIKKSRLYQIALCLLMRDFGYPLEEIKVIKAVRDHISDKEDDEPVI